MTLSKSYKYSGNQKCTCLLLDFPNPLKSGAMQNQFFFSLLITDSKEAELSIQPCKNKHKGFFLLPQEEIWILFGGELI